MKHSPEIERFMREGIAALERGDLAAVGEMTSRHEGVIGIGTDPGEYARGYDQVIGLMGDSTPEAELELHVRLDEVHGYEEGDIGWADCTGSFERHGQTVPVRITLVARREDGVWRDVQTHSSIAVPNEHMFDELFQTSARAR
jgi:ketosteroid isomerase-like protein